MNVISVPARIHHISSGGHLQVKKGGSVRIECSASGNPSPNVTWTRKNNILPNGKIINYKQYTERNNNRTIKHLQAKKSSFHQYCQLKTWIDTRVAFTFVQPPMALARRPQVKSFFMFSVSSHICEQ